MKQIRVQKHKNAPMKWLHNMPVSKGFCLEATREGAALFTPQEALQQVKTFVKVYHYEIVEETQKVTYLILQIDRNEISAIQEIEEKHGLLWNETPIVKNLAFASYSLPLNDGIYIFADVRKLTDKCNFMLETE